MAGYEDNAEIINQKILTDWKMKEYIHTPNMKIANSYLDRYCNSQKIAPKRLKLRLQEADFILGTTVDLAEHYKLHNSLNGVWPVYYPKFQERLRVIVRGNINKNGHSISDIIG